MGQYLAKDRLIIFVHDCADQARLDEQLAEFHVCAKKLHQVGGRYMWVLFNKQDDIPADTRDSTVQVLMWRYRAAADRYSDSVVVSILDLPGLSAKEGTQVYAALDDIKQTLQEKQSAAKPHFHPEALPNTNAPSRWELVEKVEERIKADDTDPDDFCRLLESGQLLDLGHYNYLKAGYYILLDGVSIGSSILDSVEAFMVHLERLRAVQETDLDPLPLIPNRQVRNAHC